MLPSRPPSVIAIYGFRHTTKQAAKRVKPCWVPQAMNWTEDIHINKRSGYDGEIYEVINHSLTRCRGQLIRTSNVWSSRKKRLSHVLILLSCSVSESRGCACLYLSTIWTFHTSVLNSSVVLLVILNFHGRSKKSVVIVDHRVLFLVFTLPVLAN